MSDAAYSTTKGPRDTQEDAVSLVQCANPITGDPITSIVVNDGVGGESAGERMSHVVSVVAMAHLLLSHAQEVHCCFESMRQLITTAYEAAQHVAAEHVAENAGHAGMATTTVAAYIVGDKCLIAHAGDSRAYLFRGYLRQMTRDHNERNALLEQGWTPEEVEWAARPNVITNCITVQGPIQLDYCELTLEPGDTLILCTDGLTGALTNSDFEQYLLQGSAVGAVEIANGLLAEAVSRGVTDNTTFAVYRHTGAQVPQDTGSKSLDLYLKALAQWLAKEKGRNNERHSKPEALSGPQLSSCGR